MGGREEPAVLSGVGEEVVEGEAAVLVDECEALLVGEEELARHGDGELGEGGGGADAVERDAPALVLGLRPLLEHLQQLPQHLHRLLRQPLHAPRHTHTHPAS